MIIVRDLLTKLVIDIKIYEHNIVGVVGPYEGFTMPMVKLNDYHFKYWDK